MRLIHCADLHLDAKMTANLTKEKARERKKELLLTFERMVDYAVENQVGAILIAGDLFDTKNISATARHCVSDAIQNHPQLTFFYLRGNHDRDNFLTNLESIPENLKLFEEKWTSYSLGAAEQVVISGLELGQENRGSAFHSLVLDSGKFNVIMLHGQIAETGAGERVQKIPLRELKNKGIDYLALGHIHSYQEEELDGRGVWCYPGCLEGRGFDECGVHGFVLVEIDEKSGIWRRKFIPFASRTLHTVSVNVSDCVDTLQMAECMEQELARRDIPFRDLVKLVLTGKMDVECEKDLTYLEKRFERDYYFMKISDETALRVDTDRFLLDESLKGEFVRTVMAAEDLSEEEKADVIRYGLWAISGRDA